tara:strand:- start:85 stop:342 length:258 start_codon:yes stop_codon:yes gene_type:complete
VYINAAFNNLQYNFIFISKIILNDRRSHFGDVKQRYDKRMVGSIFTQDVVRGLKEHIADNPDDTEQVFEAPVHEKTADYIEGKFG